MNKKTIRILHILTSLDRGGIETLLMTYYRLLDKDEIQFDFLIHREGEFAYSKEIEELGGLIYHVPAYNPADKMYHKALDKFFMEHSYSIVHSHLNCLSALPLRYAKKHNVPIRIAHSHIIINTYNLKSLYKMLARYFIKFYANYYFACSNEAGKWMFGRKKPIILMRNAIDSRKFVYNGEMEKSIRTALGISDNCILLGHVGRLTEQKNQEFLLRTFAKLCEMDDYRLICIGDGEDEIKLKKLAVDLNINDKVIFKCSIPNVYEYIQAFDMFLFPSKYEGLGIVAVEAQAAGMPVLCSEYVPREVKVNEDCVFLPLIEDEWVSVIQNHIIVGKRNTQRCIIDSHYDIYEAKNEIVKVYKSLYDGVK